MDFSAAANRIKERAAANGVSVRKMLQDLGLSANYLTQFKTAKHMPTKIGLIADYLGVSTDYLLGAEGSEHPEYDEQTQKILNLVKTMTPDQKAALLQLFAPDND